MAGLRRAIAGLVGRLLFRPSGEDLLRSLEAQLHTAPSFDVTTWAFDVVLGGSRVATVTARLGENSLRFDPTRLVAAVQVLLRRFLEPAEPAEPA